jgi:hypothetical protein
MEDMRTVGGWKTPSRLKNPGRKLAITSTGYRAFAVTVPEIYLHILDEEATLARHDRPQFVKMLLYRRAGLIGVTRTGPPACYRASRGDLAKRLQWKFYFTPEDGEILDERCLRLGGMPASVWLVREIHAWLGAPDEWTETKPGRYELRSAAEAVRADGVSGVPRSGR